MHSILENKLTNKIQEVYLRSIRVEFLLSYRLSHQNDQWMCIQMALFLEDLTRGDIWLFIKKEKQL